MNKVHISRICFERVFDLQHQVLWKKRITVFGFESNGKRIFNVQLPGWRDIQSGMELTIAMEKNWNKILGWKNANEQILMFIHPQYPLSFSVMFMAFEVIFILFKLSPQQYEILHAITLTLILLSFMLYLIKYKKYKSVKEALQNAKINA